MAPSVPTRAAQSVPMRGVPRREAPLWRRQHRRMVPPVPTRAPGGTLGVETPPGPRAGGAAVQMRVRVHEVAPLQNGAEAALLVGGVAGLPVVLRLVPAELRTRHGQ